MPNYQTHAPAGYMGDPKRGASLGRPQIGPDSRSMDELQAAFVQAAGRSSAALRLKENRPADGFKASAWQAAAESYREDKEELRRLVKELEARQAADAAPVKITLRKVRLDSGGYDSCGAYWGSGSPLYWAAADSGPHELDITFRADDREEAKAHVRGIIPNARFYR